MKESSSSEAIVETRERVMVSLEGKVMKREAHFLKPSTNSFLDPSSSSSEPQALCLSSFPATFEPKIWSSNVKFIGWRYPMKNWEIWVQKMVSLHESTWKKTGIYESILNSTFQIRKNNELIFELAKRWNNETKSFFFPWGEASVTLEDIMVLGGFSVIGSPVFSTIETEESKEKEKTLENGLRELYKTPSRRASHCLWMKKFFHPEDDVTLQQHQLGPPQPSRTTLNVEHEAFLALWLCRFVLPNSHNDVVKKVIPLAIELARGGTRVALAPAILASIYRDLSVLKEFIVAQTESSVTLWSPLQLVQIWAWERFPQMQPQPNMIENGETFLSRWKCLKCNVTSVKSVLEKGSFEWRPYVKAQTNWEFPKFYSEEEMWVSSNSNLALDDQVLSFARCVRGSMLVGLENVEQYLPHRVCRQFGIDQDVPDSVVAASNVSVEVAWRHYNKPVKRLFIPSRFYVGEVTTRYLEWWRKSLVHEHRGSGNLNSTPKRKKQRRSRTEKQRRDRRICADFVLQRKKKGSIASASASAAPRLKRKKVVESVSLSPPRKIMRSSAQNEESRGSELPESESTSLEVLAEFPEELTNVITGNTASSPVYIDLDSPIRVLQVEEEDISDSTPFPHKIIEEVLESVRNVDDEIRIPCSPRIHSPDGVNEHLIDNCIEMEIRFSGSIDEEDHLTIRQLVDKFEKDQFLSPDSTDDDDDDELNIAELSRSNEKCDKDECLPEPRNGGNSPRSASAVNGKGRDAKIQEIQTKILDFEDQISELKREVESLKAAKSGQEGH